MSAILNFLLRAVLVAASLVFAASALVLSVALLGVWAARAAWLRLTGRPARPFAMGRGGRAMDEWLRRARATAASRTPRADAADRLGRRVGDVTDVDPRPAASEKH